MYINSKTNVKHIHKAQTKTHKNIHTKKSHKNRHSETHKGKIFQNIYVNKTDIQKYTLTKQPIILKHTCSYKNKLTNEHTNKSMYK